jgi:hypothetical protein
MVYIVEALSGLRATEYNWSGYIHFVVELLLCRMRVSNEREQARDCRSIEAPSLHQAVHRVYAVISPFQITINGDRNVTARRELQITAPNIQFVSSEPRIWSVLANQATGRDGIEGRAEAAKGAIHEHTARLR